MDDVHAARMRAHQARKAATLTGVLEDTLAEIMDSRHSTRRFTPELVSAEHMDRLMFAAATAPSSCDRRPITVTPVTEKADRALLTGILVGGSGYTGPEVDRLGMPQLDAAHVSQSILLMATALNLGGCFVNPNIRERDVPHFHAVFGPGIFCGAIAIGHPPTFRSVYGTR